MRETLMAGKIKKHVGQIHLSLNNAASSDLDRLYSVF